MKKSTLFVFLAVLFFALSGYFGYKYITSTREASEISKLLLFISNLLLGVSMTVLARNMAAQE